MKCAFNKGDLVVIHKHRVGTPRIITQARGEVEGFKAITAGMMGFVLGFHSFQKGPYNEAWYDVHLADGRTLMMLDGWFKKVNK